MRFQTGFRGPNDVIVSCTTPTNLSALDYALLLANPGYVLGTAAGQSCVSKVGGTVADQVNPAATITPSPMPVSACAGTLNADGTCTMVSSVNDPNATASQLSTNQQDFADQLAAWRQAMQNSATGLSPGGCPNGQTGIYPNCVGLSNTNLLGIGLSNNTDLLILAAIGAGVWFLFSR